MCNKNEKVCLGLSKSIFSAIGVLFLMLWSIIVLAKSEYSYDTRNHIGGDISVTNLGDFNPGIQGESSYQALLMANSDYLYSLQGIEQAPYNGDFILHRYDGNTRTEVTRLPFQYDFEVGIPHYIAQRNKVVFFAYGMEEDFLVFDSISEEVLSYSLGEQNTQSGNEIFGVSSEFVFVGTTYFWGENDGQNIDKVVRLSQSENVEIELPIDRDRPVEQDVAIFSDGIYVKSDIGYILTDDSNTPVELPTLADTQYLFEWRNSLVFQQRAEDSIVWLDKQNLELQSYPGYLWGFTRTGEEIKALVKVGSQMQLWTFAEDGTRFTQSLTLPIQPASTDITVVGATADSIFFVSAATSQAGTTYGWWCLNLGNLEAHLLTPLSGDYNLRFNSINNTAFLWQGEDLWLSKGSEESTEKVNFPNAVTPESQYIYEFDNRLIAASNSSQFGREWLTIDEQGNTEVLDVVSGMSGAVVHAGNRSNIIFKDSFYSLQNIPDTGTELYAYRNLSSSPTLVYDLAPGVIGYNSLPFYTETDVLQNQTMIFVDSLITDTGRQLLFTDGTPENSGVLPNGTNTEYKVLGNQYYLKEAQSVSRFDAQTKAFVRLVDMPEGTSSYELVAAQDDWLAYTIYNADLQHREMFITNGNTTKSVFTGDSNYVSVTNDQMYFYHRPETNNNGWVVYKYDITADELTELSEVRSISDFRVINNKELLLTYTQDGFVQVSQLNESGDWVSVFSNPENKRLYPQDSLLKDRILFEERDLELQPFMNKIAMYLLNVATGELEVLPISERLATQQFSINYYTHKSVINARLLDVDTGQWECFLFNQSELIKNDAYCDVDAFDVGEDTLILSAIPTSVSRDSYVNHAQVFDSSLNLLFDYQTTSESFRQKRFKFASDGIVYHIGNGQSEELWWKGTKQNAPIQILKDFDEFQEKSGLSSLTDISWQAVNGKLLMRGNENSIGAEPFVLNMYCHAEIQMMTTITQEDDSFSLAISPGETVPIEFVVKSMQPVQMEDIQASEIPGLSVRLENEDGLFVLHLEAATDFTGEHEFTLTANGECGDDATMITVRALENQPPPAPPAPTPPAPTPPEPTPQPDSTETSSGGSSSWILLVLAITWLRRAEKLKRFATHSCIR